MFLSQRRREPEWMDEAGVDPAELYRSLGFIRRVNSWLGYTRATIKHLERFSRSWRPGERIDIIDLATGSADIPRAILKWAAGRGFDVHVVGVDRHPITATIAALNHPPHPPPRPVLRERVGVRAGAHRAKASANQSRVEAVQSDPDDRRLHIVQADVFNLPFAPASFDYALTAMFLHHLDDRQAVTVLKTMSSLARRGVIVADLLRHYRAYAWISLFTAFAGPMVRHDAKVSVGQAFSKKEVQKLRDAGGLFSRGIIGTSATGLYWRGKRAADKDGLTD